MNATGRDNHQPRPDLLEEAAERKEVMHPC
jgi:hypothetical protein